MMKLSSRSVIASTVLAACAAAAVAQAPTSPPAAAQPPAMMRDNRAQHDQHMQERMQQRMQRRTERLRRILQITPQQENAFNGWITAMRPAAKQRPNRDELARLSTPERIERMKQLRGARMAEMDRRGEATKAFYAQLTPAQQKAFDEISMRFLRGGRGGGGHGGHHGPRHYG